VDRLRDAQVTAPLESAAVAAVFLAAFALFAPALVAQFRGDQWLPRWVPGSLRRRSGNTAARAASILWTVAWSLGGQALILYLAVVRLNDGELAATLILMLEFLIAAVLAGVLLRISHSTPAA
jgi:hypothetical protein